MAWTNNTEKKTAIEKSKNRSRALKSKKIAIFVENGLKPIPSHSNNNDKFIEFAKIKKKEEKLHQTKADRGSWFECDFLYE